MCHEEFDPSLDDGVRVHRVDRVHNVLFDILLPISSCCRLKTPSSSVGAVVFSATVIAATDHKVTSSCLTERRDDVTDVES